MAEGFNPVLLRALCRAVGIDATTLVRLFSTGFPVIGDFAAPGVYDASVADTNRISGEALLLEARARWAELPRLLARERSKDALWRSALKEVKQGWLSPPAPASGVDRDRAVPARRFGAQQGEKLRPRDNCRRSGTNSAAAAETPIRLPSIEDLAEIATRASEARAPRPAGNWVFFKADRENAYRQAPVSPERSRACAIVLAHPESGEAMCFFPRTLVFGSSAAVLAYNVVARTLASVFARYFSIPLVNFFDDFAGAAPAEAGLLAAFCFRRMNELIGFSCKREKEEVGEQITFLGLGISCAKLPVTIWLPPEKREKYLDFLLDVRLGGARAPSTAASAAGRLNFATAGIWGRAPRVFIKPFYRHASGGSATAPRRLLKACDWWRNFLRSPPRRAYVSTTGGVEALLYTDASDVGLGAALVTPGAPVLFWSTKVPPTFSVPPGSSRIYVLELLAAALGAQALETLRRGAPAWRAPRNVVMFVDNNAALVSLLRGHAKDPLADAAISLFWHTQARAMPNLAGKGEVFPKPG